MSIKLAISILLVLSMAVTVYFQPEVDRGLLGAPEDASLHPRVRFMTWNIGYAALENDTRAHSEDLPAVAETILQNDPDAVALQELAGEQQLYDLLQRLGGKYRGYSGRQRFSDRTEAVLVKDPSAQFADVPTRRTNAASARFRAGFGLAAKQILFVSAHADAFSAVRRRHYTEDVVDWLSSQFSTGSVVLLAGDFNFELSTAKETNFFTDNVKQDSEAYSLILTRFRDFGRNAGDTAINERRIDYVFGPASGINIIRAEVLRNAAVGRMDHWPLVVEVEL